MEAIWIFRSRNSDLVGTVINIHNGDWVRRGKWNETGTDVVFVVHFVHFATGFLLVFINKMFWQVFLILRFFYLSCSLVTWSFLLSTDSSVGAGIDSYYEYCLKAYILLGDETLLERFNRVCCLFLCFANCSCYYWLILVDFVFTSNIHVLPRKGNNNSFKVKG